MKPLRILALLVLAHLAAFAAASAITYAAGTRFWNRRHPA